MNFLMLLLTDKETELKNYIGSSRNRNFDIAIGIPLVGNSYRKLKKKYKKIAKYIFQLPNTTHATNTTNHHIGRYTQYYIVLKELQKKTSLSRYSHFMFPVTSYSQKSIKIKHPDKLFSLAKKEHLSLLHPTKLPNGMTRDESILFFHRFKEAQYKSYAKKKYISYKSFKQPNSQKVKEYIDYNYELMPHYSASDKVIRYSNKIELLCPIVDLHVLHKSLKFMKYTNTGWGLEEIWSQLARSKIAIADYIDVIILTKITKASPPDPAMAIKEMKKILGKFYQKRKKTKNFNTFVETGLKYRSINLETTNLTTTSVLQNGLKNIPNIGQNPLDYVLKQMTKTTIPHGLWLEFGVFTGDSIRKIAKYLTKSKNTTIQVYGFDSFEGLPDRWNNRFQKGAFDLKGQLPKVPKNVTLIRGWFDKTLPKFLKNHKGNVSFLHIDCDLYSSTVTILKLLKDRIKKGTVVVFDELVNYPDYENHEWKAWREFTKKNGINWNWIGINGHVRVKPIDLGPFDQKVALIVV